MEVTGTIKVIGETQTFGAKGFRKRELVITTDEQYPQSILVEFVQDKCDLLDKFEVGKNVKIGINLRGREWVNPQGETKYFNSIQGWRISKMAPAAADGESSDMPPMESYTPDMTAKADEEDDLPF